MVYHQQCIQVLVNIPIFCPSYYCITHIFLASVFICNNHNLPNLWNIFFAQWVHSSYKCLTCYMHILFYIYFYTPPHLMSGLWTLWCWGWETLFILVLGNSCCDRANLESFLFFAACHLILSTWYNNCCCFWAVKKTQTHCIWCGTWCQRILLTI